VTQHLAISRRHRHKQNAPHETEHRRCNAERNHVRQRVDLTAEIAHCVRHPRNPAVQAIKKHSEPQRFRCNLKMYVGAQIPALCLQSALNGLRNSHKAQKDVAARE
jgi:hypothetical protein